MTEVVLIGIELPIDASELVEDVVSEMGKDADVTIKHPEASENATSDLTFDPVTGSAIAWFLLKFASETAVALAAATIGEIVFKKLQEHRELARKTVRCRFPDGTVYNIVVDSPERMVRLRQVIAERAQR